MISSYCYRNNYYNYYKTVPQPPPPPPRHRLLRLHQQKLRGLLGRSGQEEEEEAPAQVSQTQNYDQFVFYKFKEVSLHPSLIFVCYLPRLTLPAFPSVSSMLFLFCFDW